MKFLMLVCRDPSIEMPPEQRSGIGSDVQAWVSEMEERGVRLDGDVLAPIDASATVCMRDGKLLVGHGPQAEMAAPASGFNLLECADLKEAIEVSAKHPIARFGVIELRPIAES